jgi:hypothetical protein
MFGKPESILICISDLPAGVSRRTLKGFVQHGVDAVRSRGLRVKPAITNHTIVRLTNLDTGAMSHQGLVAIQPAKLAFKVIDELSRTPLRGQLLKVSRYRHCSFEVESLTQTKSISDLLGVTPNQSMGNRPRLILDLVTSTGIDSPATSLQPQAAQKTGPQQTAHRKTTSKSSPQIDSDSVFA